MTKSIRLALAIALASLLPACSMFGGKSDYQEARETRPLEVPPELDAPATNAAMTVPAVAGSASATAPSTSPRPIEAGPDARIAVVDSVAGAWKRVGLALERSGVAELVARDEASATYTVRGTTVITQRAEGGFIRRMFSGGDKERSETVTRVVRVVADGTGSVVQVEDEQGAATDDELSRRLVEAIRQRLG
jgi:uncharacterized lipoprotein